MLFQLKKWAPGVLLFGCWFCYVSQEDFKALSKWLFTRGLTNRPLPGPWESRYCCIQVGKFPFFLPPLSSPHQWKQWTKSSTAFMQPFPLPYAEFQWQLESPFSATDSKLNYLIFFCSLNFSNFSNGRFPTKTVKCIFFFFHCKTIFYAKVVHCKILTGLISSSLPIWGLSFRKENYSDTR